MMQYTHRSPTVQIYFEIFSEKYLGRNNQQVISRYFLHCAQIYFMKSLLLCIALLSAATFSAIGQTRSFTFSNPSNTDERTDTVLNAVTMYLTGSTNLSGPISFHIIGTKVSGTVAATVYLEGSDDAAATTYTPLDSVSFTNIATNQMARQYSYAGYSKYRWRIVPTGTQAFIVRAYYRTSN